jgi:ABC-type glycerol-3-phosphate transport system substrate-binding protein
MEGWYYDKKVLAKVGGQVPTTVSQFNALLARAKAKGVPGIQMGDSDQSASQILPVLALSSTLPTATFQKLSTFDLSHGTALNDGGPQAGSLLRTWGTALPAGYRGYNGDDAISRFSAGQGLFFPSGDWMIPIFSKSLGRNFGFFLPPRLGAGTRSAPFGAGGAWIIPTNSNHPTAAAVYLNFMTSVAAAKILAANDAIPARPIASTHAGARSLPAFRDLLAAASYLTKNKSGAQFQVSTDATAQHDPTGASQAVLAGHISSSQWLKAEEGFVSAAVAAKPQ